MTENVVNDPSLSKEDRQRIFGDSEKIPGHLPLVTGGGKTTKTINDLVKGGEKYVILVTPNKGLAQSGVKHHDG